MWHDGRREVVWPIFTIGLTVWICGCRPETSEPAVASDYDDRPRPPAAAPALTEEDEAAVRLLEDYFAESDSEKRGSLAERIEALPQFDPDRLSTWLHAMEVFPERAPGMSRETVTLPDGSEREVWLRIPSGYDTRRAWPVILVYHQTGGSGDGMVRALAASLGRAADDYVMVGPTDYRPMNVESRRAAHPEPRPLIQFVRRQVHVDSDRLYAVGYSQGGYACWSLGTFFGDELAAIAPHACTYDAAPEIPGLWAMLLPNLRHVDVLHVWGDRDTLGVPGFDLQTTIGTVPECNDKLEPLVDEIDLPVQLHVIEGGGHSWQPVPRLLRETLQTRRVDVPSAVRHRFRYLHQGRSYWLESMEWEGRRWKPEPRRWLALPGESREEMFAREIDELLAALEGTVEGGRMTIQTRHVKRLRIRFLDGLVDWNQPVVVLWNGAVRFEGPVARDLPTCLEEARRTFDFDRLCWAHLDLALLEEPVDGESVPSPTAEPVDGE